MKTIAIIDDDIHIGDMLREVLVQEGYSVLRAYSGTEALYLLSQNKPDLVLLDLGLPDMDGMEVLKSVRKWSNLPVVVVSARNHEHDKVEALDLGADDYISKPFRPRELLSRINSVLRRTKNTQNIISYHDLVVDTNQATVVKNGTEILLSAMEYKLLLVFLRNKGIVLSRRRLLELLWDTTGEFINDNTLTVYMKRLRDKIETNPQEPEIIITVRGLGYKVG